MSALADLKACVSFHDVARMLGFTPRAVAYLLYRLPEHAKYTTFSVPKRSGGMRTIAAPCAQLKLLQRNLAGVLQDSLEEIQFRRGKSDGSKRPDRISHGFRRRRSIVTNALQHRAQRFVFNVDVEDFFGSINFGRVRGFFIKDRDFALHPPVATVLAQIACFQNRLPQGSPCSPVISNLVGHVVDIHLTSLAKAEGITYSRYADDLTFSTNKCAFPPSVAVADETVAHKWVPGGALKRLIDRGGFRLNEAKTRMQYHDSRQLVTGLVVNRKINAPDEYRRHVRMLVHTYTSTGSFFFKRKGDASVGPVQEVKEVGKPEQLRGMLEYIVYASRRGTVADYSAPLNSPERLYRTFVLFHDFYAPPMPLVLCEGKTDLVYIAQAARSLATSYPQLANVAADGKIKLLFRRHRYPIKGRGRLTARVLGIHGGAPDIKEFIQVLHREYEAIKAPPGEQPVIITLDDDDGVRKIRAYVKHMFGKDLDQSVGFHHLFGNVYVVLTPTPFGKTSSNMEDLFDAATQAVVLNGRTFDASKDNDSKTTYGKATFAYEVVAKQDAAINFMGFRPLLDRFVEVLNDYRGRRATAP
ncbi:MAG TPA: retron Ec67 family RNA-directed DNA polymerase/endonuclease [Burkholderiaceae bacterium]